MKRLLVDAALVVGAVLAASPVHAQDAKAGHEAFAQCTVCHATDDANGAGPSLKGVVGRKAGSYPGFRYSRAMKSADLVWDAAKLDAYLADPQKTIPNNVMPFSGIAEAHQRADLIAYLQTLK